MTLIPLSDNATKREHIGTREPPAIFWSEVKLDSLIFNDDEYYILTLDKNEYLRRKIGSWINVSKFIPLITDTSRTKLEREIEAMENTHTLYVQGRNSGRFKGVWTTLSEARNFAKRHNIHTMLSPLLDFERIALVKYLGVKFYEFFSHVSVDVHIRVLREKETDRINMEQIFVVYTKIKGDRANRLLSRSFYQHYNDFRKRSDRTLCGGNWVPVEAASKFALKHGFHKQVMAITDFESTPDRCWPYPMDVYERSCRNHWVATVCDSNFFGFPSSFRGGLAPKSPGKKRGKIRKEFSLEDLIISKDLSIELTKQGKGVTHRVTLYRRKSDGWVNVSKLVAFCVMVRLCELDLGKDDPDLHVENELYYRDVLERYSYETVVTPKRPTLNGKWCSAKDSKDVLLNLRIANSEQYRDVSAFLDAPELRALDTLDVDEVNDSSDEEDIELIDETNFLRHKHTVIDRPLFRDEKFFGDAAPSDEEPYLLHGVTDDEPDVEEIVTTDSDSDLTPILEPILKRPRVPNGFRKPKITMITLGDSDEEVEEEKEIDADQFPFKRQRVSSEQQLFEKQGQRTPLFVMPDEDFEFDAVSQEADDQEAVYAADAADNDDSEDSVEKNEIDVEDSQENSREGRTLPPKGPTLEDITRALKAIVRDAEDLIKNSRKIHTTRVQRGLGGVLKSLRMFNAIDPGLKFRTKLTSLLKTVGPHVNHLQKDLDDLEERWKFEYMSREEPSITPASQAPRPWPRPAPAPNHVQLDSGNQSFDRPSDQQNHHTQQFNGPGPQHSPGSLSYQGFTPVAHDNNFALPIPPFAYNQQQQPPPPTMNSRWHPSQGNQPAQWQQNPNPNVNSNYNRGPVPYPGQGHSPYYGQRPPPSQQQPPSVGRTGPPPMNGPQYGQSHPTHQKSYNYAPHLPPQQQQQQQQQQLQHPPHPQQGYYNNQINNYGLPPHQHQLHNQGSVHSQSMISGAAAGPVLPMKSGPPTANHTPPHKPSYNASNTDYHDNPASKRIRERPQQQHLQRPNDRVGKRQAPPLQSSTKRTHINSGVKHDDDSYRGQSEVRVPVPKRPLSPPSNYCAIPGEPLDPPDFGLKESKEHDELMKMTEKDVLHYNKLFDGKEMEKYKNAARWKIGTRQDNLWRDDLIFQDNGDGVSIARKIFCMLLEEEKRGTCYR